MKEFLDAADDEKKVVLTKLEEEVEKLTGSTARLTQSLIALSH